MTSKSNGDDPASEPFLNSVESALDIHAFSYCTFPAENLYDKAYMSSQMDIIETCHIYLIGFTPVAEFVAAEQVDDVIRMKFSVAGTEFFSELDVPLGYSLNDKNGHYFIENASGDKLRITDEYAFAAMRIASGIFNFEVKYIGQSYGVEGSRNAIDRLLKHETLQEISLKGAPSGYRVSILLLSLYPATRVLTTYNPNAKRTYNKTSRIDLGLDKKYHTTEKEQITLYEAALIRYFYPEYNEKLKDSFPPTNLEMLRDCYDKDINAIVAEICFEDYPFYLFSERIEPAAIHIIMHELHKEKNRRAFFGFLDEDS